MRLSILEDVKKEAIKKYDELKDYTNSNEGLVMIVFTTRTIRERHLTDLRDEDTDEYLGIYNGEWILYTHDIEYFQGPIKIKNEKIQILSSKQVLDYINKLDDKNYMSFLKESCKIYRWF